MTLPSILVASFAVSVDTTIVNVSLPTLVRELDASTSELQWIVGAYSLVFAALLLAAGSLSDRVGRKGVLLAGLAVFGLASAAGGLTDSPEQLIVARGAMGLGAALIFPATLSLISNIFPERDERARAIGLWGATTGAAVALGPIAGGWLLETFDWSAIFFAMAPVAALAALLIGRTVPTSRDPDAPRADRPGLVLSASAIALLIYTIIEAPDYGWGAGRTVAGFAVAAVLLVLFVLWQRRASAPLVDVSLFRNLRFTAASASVTVVFFSLSGFLFLITQYFQFFKGYGPLSTGVRMLPVALSLAPMSVIGTKMAVRYGTKVVVAIGLVCLAVFFVWVSTDSETTGYFVIASQMVLSGIGMGLSSAPATEAIMGVVPKAKAGVGSAVNDATRILGATLGVAVIGSVYASVYSSRLVDALPAGVPGPQADAAEDSVGAALALAGRAGPALGDRIHEAAASAFFDGMSSGLLVAAGVAAVGAVVAASLLPAQPVVSHEDVPVAPPVPAVE
ncbi:MAG TPA: MFS transporter [Thermoleophilaceae bacterium]